MPVKSDKELGLYGKYTVRRVDGSSGPGCKHEKCFLFVLDLDHDEFAVEALEAYAGACEKEYPHLAADLRKAIVEHGTHAEDDGSTLYAVELKKRGDTWKMLGHTISSDRSFVTNYLRIAIVEEGEEVRLATFKRSGNEIWVGNTK